MALPVIAAAFVPFLMAGLRLFIVANIVGLVLRVFVGLGVYFFVMAPIGDQITGMLMGRLGGAPRVAIEWIGYLQVDVYIQTILSAYTVLWASNFVLRMRQS